MKKTIIIAIAVLFLLVQYISPRYGAAACQSDHLPWSGYWWPSVIGGLVNGGDYNGNPSPLAKYDEAISGYSQGPAMNFGYSRYYDPEGPPWAGMCFNLAAAAILEEEPRYRGVYNNVLFNVGDKKALLTVAYDGVLHNFHDIDTPLDFHELVMQFLCVDKTPVIMDLGSADQIWTYPVYKYESTSVTIGSRRHYETTVYYATNEVKPDYVGTKQSTAIFYYYFDLAADGSTVVGSAWEYGSIDYPPKNISEPYAVHSITDAVDYEKIKAIVAAVDDPYEDNDSFEKAKLISAGTYSLLAIDDDFFTVSLRKGDTIKIDVTPTETSPGSLVISLSNPSRRMVSSFLTTGHIVYEAEESGDFYIGIQPADVGSGMTYSLSISIGLNYTYYLPVNPPGLWSEALALLNGETDLDRVVVTLIDRKGQPVKSRMINEGNEITHLAGSLDVDFALQQDSDGYVRIDSDTSLRGFMAVTDGNYRSFGMNLLSQDDLGYRIHFPHIPKTGGWRSTFGIINVSDSAIAIIRQPYDESGNQLTSDRLDLDPGEKIEFVSNSSLLSSQARSLTVSVENNSYSIIGYMKCILPWFSPRGEAFINISPRLYGDELIIPHVASNAEWKTGFAVMNIGAKTVSMECSAYDTEGNPIGLFSRSLSPKQNFVAEISSIFPEIQPEIISAVRFRSLDGTRLCGFLKYLSSDGLQLEGMQISGPGSSKLHLPRVAAFHSWNTGLAVMNAGVSTDTIRLSLFDESGNILCTKDVTLVPNEKTAQTIDALFQGCINEEASYMTAESESGQALSGLFLMNSDDQRWLMGDLLQ